MKIKILILLSSLSVFGAACSSTSQTASNGEAVSGAKTTGSAAPTSSQVASASASEAHKHWHPMKLIREALDACSLSADQQTKVTALRDAFRSRHQKTEAAEQAFRTALADQVAAGTIDSAKLKTQLDALSSAVTANQKDNLAAITSLHDLLDSKQRNTFVDYIESHGPGHEALDGGEGHRHHGGPGMHGGFGPLKEWREYLNLTDAQVQQIRQAMRDKLGREGHKEMFKHFEEMHAQLEAFRADSFTPDATLFSFDKMSGHMLTLAEIAEPILTPEQRQLAAQKLRETPKWHMGDAGH